VTVCTVAIYMLLNLPKVTQNTFRWLVFGIFLSIIYDLFWFSMKTQEYTADLKADAGLERRIRLFSLYMSYISFFLRLVMALIYWKDSLDFDNIMLGKRISIVEPSVQSVSPKNVKNDRLFLREVSPKGKNTVNPSLRF